MADLNHNGIDDAIEEREYKAHAVNAKFRQQISYGVGAAMVFGLMTGLVGKLVGLAFPAAATTAIGTSAAVAGGSAILPILGLVALGAVGVGLLYLSAKFLSENIVLDQQLQAKQISSATRGNAPAIEPVIEPKTQQFPDSAPLKADVQMNDNTPSTIIGNERELASTVMQGAQAARVA